MSSVFVAVCTLTKLSATFETEVSFQNLQGLNKCTLAKSDITEETKL